MKKKLTTLALILIAALSMLALCACNNGPSSEEVIREGLSGELDTIVNKKGDDWDEMISDIEDEADLSQFGICLLYTSRCTGPPSVPPPSRTLSCTRSPAASAASNTKR